MFDNFFEQELLDLEFNPPINEEKFVQDMVYIPYPS